jgi:hypothetical protein
MLPSHWSVCVHVFSGTTDPVSVTQAPSGMAPTAQLAGSDDRLTHGG